MTSDRGCGNPAFFYLLTVALSALAGAILGFVIWLIAF